jgi:hypothetical protein
MLPAPIAAGLQYWLMVNDTPAGPFAPADVHAKLAAGEVTWQTPACLLGTSNWLPLERIADVRFPPDASPAAPSKPNGPDPAWRARFQSALQIGFPLVFAVLTAYVLYTNKDNGWTGRVERVFKAGGGGLIAGLIFGGIPSAIIGASALGWQVAVLTTAIGGVMGLYIGPPSSLPATLSGIMFGLWAGAIVKLVQAAARSWVAMWPGGPRSPSASLAARKKRFGTWPVAGAIAACLGAGILACYYAANSGDNSNLPAAYQPYFPRGRLVPTGNASLDYWLHVNIELYIVENQVIGMDEYFQSDMLRIEVNSIRRRPVTGVDPDLSAWAELVIDLLEARAVILDRRTDSRAAGRPAALPPGADARDQQLSGWERDHDRLAREGQALRDALSRRHGREFPPCRLGSPDVRPTPR